MIWTAWVNGTPSASGSGYGLKVPITDRDRYFDRSWDKVTIELPTESGSIEAETNVKKASFWNNTCHELISKDIGQWLLICRLAPWPKGKPPKLEVEVREKGRFVVTRKL